MSPISGGGDCYLKTNGGGGGRRRRRGAFLMPKITRHNCPPTDQTSERNSQESSSLQRTPSVAAAAQEGRSSQFFAVTHSPIMRDLSSLFDFSNLISPRCLLFVHPFQNLFCLLLFCKVLFVHLSSARLACGEYKSLK